MSRRLTLSAGGATFAYYSIPAATKAGLGDFSKLPAALKVVLENMLRFEDGGRTVSVDDIKAFAEWGAKGGKNPRQPKLRGQKAAGIIAHALPGAARAAFSISNQLQ